MSNFGGNGGTTEIAGDRPRSSSLPASEALNIWGFPVYISYNPAFEALAMMETMETLEMETYVDAASCITLQGYSYIYIYRRTYNI